MNRFSSSSLGGFIRLAVGVLASLFLATGSRADTINFDNFADSTIITNQIAGLTFTNSIILTAGFSLNEFEFPPQSGSNVLSDNGGPITITFATDVSNVSAYFTYAVPLTLTAYDATNHVLGTIGSAFSNNEALSGVRGSSPNELISFGFGDITTLVITGDPLGSILLRLAMRRSRN